MRLKHISIYGFKSFADKTEIDVDDNFVAVVGSNGCGKSNLADAIIWALGEPNPRNLRAATSLDVIFSGSAKRKPLGYAEVSLIFDNESGLLPVNTSEVIITRRLDRKGESWFGINGRACRLKDIHELFADTGMGKTGYAVVGQGDIDAALNASAEERRVWIDEAAGVQKYRSRKADALKRLESAVAHLQRVSDVIVELERQREPLREQAESAKKYQEISTELRDIETGLLIKEMVQLANTVDSLSTEIAAKRERATKMRLDADAAEMSVKRLNSEVVLIEEQLEDQRKKLQQQNTAVERSQGKKSLIEQRLESLDEIEASSERDKSASVSRLQSAERNLQMSKKDLEFAKDAVDHWLAKLTQSKQAAKQLAEDLANIERELSKARSKEIDRIERHTQVVHAERRLSEVKRELKGAEDALPALKNALEEAKLAYEKSLEKASECRDRESKLQLAIEEKRDYRKVLEAKRVEKQLQAAEIEGRCQGLRSSLDAYDGLPYGAKNVLNAVSNGHLKGDFVPVSYALTIPSEYAIAIEAALGTSAGDLLTSHSDYAKLAINFLKEKLLGRATFLPLNLLKPLKNEVFSTKTEFIGVASDLVFCSNEHSLAIESILGRTAVVSDLAAAINLAKEGVFQKVVTLDGEVVFGKGAISGGRSRKDASGPVRAATELQKLDDDLFRIKSEYKALVEEVEEQDRMFYELIENLKFIRNEIKTLDLQVYETSKWFTDVREEYTSTTKAIDRMKHEISSILEIQESTTLDLSLKEDVTEIESQRDQILRQAAASSADAEQARQMYENAKTDVDKAFERLRQAELDLNHAQEADRVRLTKLENVNDERDAMRSQLKEIDSEVEQLLKILGESEERLESLQNQRKYMLDECNRLSEDAKQLREAARILEDNAYQEDIQRARSETKRSGLVAKLLEDYEISEEEAFKLFSSIQVAVDAERLAAKLRRELRALGVVNIGAIEAYESVTERYETLVSQRLDILTSKAELDKSIHELDKLTRGAFYETFNKVNETFNEIFNRLFDGGNARLILTDPDNLLESGVEIEVQVPGKRTQRLELLSGGERALSACALLFALFKVKPSPLCILDELDAPLDGRNVARYAELLTEFSQTSQFLVITHNEVTIEAASLWFGLSTQGEPGVSFVLPYRADVKNAVSMR